MTVMQPPQPQQWPHQQYPSSAPLTPGTPDYNSTTSFGNESGYETSSYYSQHSQHVDHQPHHPHQQQQHQGQWSPPVHQHFYPAMTSTTTAAASGRIPAAYYENSEEDDLLDAIVNWEDKE